MDRESSNVDDVAGGDVESGHRRLDSVEPERDVENFGALNSVDADAQEEPRISPEREQAFAEKYEFSEEPSRRQGSTDSDGTTWSRSTANSTATSFPGTRS